MDRSGESEKAKPRGTGHTISHHVPNFPFVVCTLHVSLISSLVSFFLCCVFPFCIKIFPHLLVTHLLFFLILCLHHLLHLLLSQIQTHHSLHPSSSFPSYLRSIHQVAAVFVLQSHQLISICITSIDSHWLTPLQFRALFYPTLHHTRTHTNPHTYLQRRPLHWHMAPLPQYFLTQQLVVIIIILLPLFGASTALVPSSTDDIQQANELQFLGRRILQDQSNDGAEEDAMIELPKKKKPKLVDSSVVSSVVAKNKTKLLKTSAGGLKNQTKLIKPKIGTTADTILVKNKTKLIKPVTGFVKNKTKSIKSVPGDDALGASKGEALIKIKIKKLNTTKSSNSTKSSTGLSKKSLDLIKIPGGGSSAKNKTIKSTKSTSEKGNVNANPQSKPAKTTSSNNSIKSKPNPNSNTDKNNQPNNKQNNNWVYDSSAADDDDIVTGFQSLPSKFQQSIIPDLNRISTNSKIYLSKANKEITRDLKPYVGTKHATTIATAISFTFIVIPFILVSLIINKFKSHFSIQRLVIFVQIYLSIYFSILCLSSLVTGLEPLRFFYATSQSTYVWVQVIQTLGYVMYLLLVLMYLVLVFSTESGLGSKFLGLGQTFVGFAVGLHYYMTVFHRVVLKQPPRTNWKVHGIYATCFLVICLFAAADRRKKAYMEDGGEEGKRN